MSMNDKNQMLDQGLRSYPWLLTYRTSSTIIDGRPVEMLHDFYLPALQRAVRYDRVAGYFRSSSLAAASQGFSSFVNREGKMRLIVGADLELDDVYAILQGDEDRLAKHLNRELDQPASWPDEVQNGVTLLAWMVANEFLEVRVAFRLHKDTGKPLTFEDTADGYVHEKWFVLYDDAGNRLYGSGTLNESKTALLMNAENVDVHCDWWGDIEQQRTEQAVLDFEKLWLGRVSHVPVLKLPEAVRLNLIKMAEGITRPVEIDGTATGTSLRNEPSALERLQFAVLRDAPRMPGGRFVGMETAPVKPWPHQAVVVRRLVETWPYSYLLCDEVGLGKTIEAGLAFRSLYLSGLVKRILIAAPASLTTQWQRQMASKVLMSFALARTTPEISHEYIFPREVHCSDDSLFGPDLLIVSTGILARRERAEALRESPSYDIALVDEAHAVRRRNPAKGPNAQPEYGYLYIAVRDYVRAQSRCLWMATATPMQVDPVEVCDLLALTNRVGVFQNDPSLILQYYRILGKLACGRDADQFEWVFLRRAIKSIQMQDALLWLFIKNSVIDGRTRFTVKQWLQDNRIPRGRDLQLILPLIFSASPLSRVMLRHTRKLLEVYREHGELEQNLATRHIESTPSIKFNSLEQGIYDQLEKYCAGLSEQIQKHGDSKNRQMMSFLLSFLRLRFASSLYAFRETIKRRLHKVEATLQHQSNLQAVELRNDELNWREWVYEDENEDDPLLVETLLKNRSKIDLEWEKVQLKNMLYDLDALHGDSSKMNELLKILDLRRESRSARIQQTVIFTRFYDTLHDIVTRLHHADPEILVGTYSGKGAGCYDPGVGKMINLDREEVKERFLRGEIDVLVCTDAAAEGLNLQTANLLINFDLPWNPMKVEQRIGRIDRIGQKHEDIYVLNLFYVGSVEEIVYGRLLTRLKDANLIVGTQQISLLPVEPDDFRRLTEGELSPEELELKVRKRLEEQQRYASRTEMNPNDLYQIYRRMSSGGSAPVNLDGIWDAITKSTYLLERGRLWQTDKEQKVFVISGLNDRVNNTSFTVSRELYDEGLTDGSSRLHFASYGDPCFEALIEHMCSIELPACVKQISVQVNGLDQVDMLSYVVACSEPGSIRSIRLIKSWKDLQDLTLDEDYELTDTDIAPLQSELEEIAKQEFSPYLGANRIERQNKRAAYVQELLNLLSIRDLIDVRAGDGDGQPFWPVKREIASLLENHSQLTICGLPASILRDYTGDLLFDAQVSSIGEDPPIKVPSIVLESAVASGERLANGMKKSKRDLTVKTIMNRLQREIEEKRRLISDS